MIIRIQAPGSIGPAREWLKDRGIYNDLYELGYDMISDPTPDGSIELAPVLRIDDGVLADSDVTEFILRFGV